MFAPWSTLTAFTSVIAVLGDVGINNDAWDAWLQHIGPLGNNVRVLAALPAIAVVTAVGNAIKSDGSPLNPVEAAQVGLCWRTARRAMGMQSGLEEKEFKDHDPWVPPAPTT